MYVHILPRPLGHEAGGTSTFRSAPLPAHRNSYALKTQTCLVDWAPSPKRRPQPGHDAPWWARAAHAGVTAEAAAEAAGNECTGTHGARPPVPAGTACPWTAVGTGSSVKVMIKTHSSSAGSGAVAGATTGTGAASAGTGARAAPSPNKTCDTYAFAAATAAAAAAAAAEDDEEQADAADAADEANEEEANAAYA